jgi:hypothetical protein
MFCQLSIIWHVVPELAMSLLIGHVSYESFEAQAACIFMMTLLKKSIEAFCTSQSAESEEVGMVQLLFVLSVQKDTVANRSMLTLQDPSKVFGFQIRSRKLPAQSDLQEVTASSIMTRSFEGEMASYAMLVSCPWWVCAYCDVVLPALMDVREDEWPAKDSFSDLTEFLCHHAEVLARVDEDTSEAYELKKKVDAFVQRYGGHAIAWGR